MIEHIIESSKRRIDATRRTIENLLDLEFPYTDSEQALTEVKRIFEETSLALSSAKDSTDESLKRGVAETALERLIIYIPLLGFILRSTNVRNAFEIHGPLLRISKKLLKKEVRLLLSSEWEYSPMTYLNVPRLRDFILIGFPATESANPFLIPLSGHELGHNLWTKHELKDQVNEYVTRLIQQKINEDRWEEFSRLYDINETNDPEFWNVPENKELIAQAATWATMQAEETFCDLIGMRIFGSSFLHAFVYLLSPGQKTRFLIYPSLKNRMRTLLNAAQTWGIDTRLDYTGAFQADEQVQLIDKEVFQLELAEYAVGELELNIRDAANELVTDAGLGIIKQESVEKILKCIKNAVPAEKEISLAEVINAGWEAHLDKDLWADFKNMTLAEKFENLKEVILKSIEVLEVQSRLGEGE